MLGKWFRRKEPDVEQPETDRDALLTAAVAEQRAKNPLAGAQVAGKDILARLMDVSRDERGVHVETLFMALGAVAGFACQISVRAIAAAEGREPPFTIATTADGRSVYFGDALNAPLAEDRYSVWSLAAAAVETSGAPLPDLHELFGHVAKTVGSAEFGRPRYPEGTGSATLPEAVVRDFWPVIADVLGRFCGAPGEWPVAGGLAIQEAIELARSAIAPDTACRIAMETAIAMSKIDPSEVGISVPRTA